MKRGFSDEKVKIRKIEAATRQLNAAIALWFNDGDIVATHTIACAAHQIIADLVKDKESKGVMLYYLPFTSRGRYGDKVKHDPSTHLPAISRERGFEINSLTRAA